MQFHQAQYRPHTYIVENDYGKQLEATEGNAHNQLGTVCNDYDRQLGTVDEFHDHKNGGVSVYYVAIRFDNKGMFEQKDFPGFTAALQFAGKR